MSWVLPNGSRVKISKNELIGSGPYWVALKDSLYKLSPSAQAIAGLFKQNDRLVISTVEAGPILSALIGSNSPFILEQGVENRPEGVLLQPTCHVDLSARFDSSDRLRSYRDIQISARLELRYPENPPGKIILFNRSAENSARDVLNNLKFTQKGKSIRGDLLFELSGTNALSFIYEGVKLLPPDWQVSGLEKIRESIKFADLILNISLEDESASVDEMECNIVLEQNGSVLPISTLFKGNLNDNDEWIELDNGSVAKIPAGTLLKLKSLLGIVENNLRVSNGIKRRITTSQALSLSLSSEPSVRVATSNKLKKLKNNLENFSGIEPTSPKTSSFKGSLRHYQQYGVGWLLFLYDAGLGGILADEMGLGKTVQTLAFIRCVLEAKDRARRFNGPVLIVAPTSVTTNWMMEAERFTPDLNVLQLVGALRRKNFKDIVKADIVVTSYPLIRLDHIELQRHRFGAIFLDEAQNIKNHQAAISQAIKGISAPFRICLSGTPTENRPSELWSLFDFVMPGYLGSYYSFRMHFERPIAERGVTSVARELLSSKIRPFLLRRTKDQVASELPPKIESVLYAPMTPTQAALYDKILYEVKPELEETIKTKGFSQATISILASLTRLRQICNHPRSLSGFEELAEFDSGKFEAAKEIVIEALASGRKVLLFSQFRAMLSLFRNWLDQEEVNYLYLDGLTKDRQQLIDRFNNEPSVKLFLLSLKAGGLGLNLTAADTVVLYDPWWNPAVESQAVDRAHRIGQKKQVHVYYLITSDSIEAKMRELQSKKKEMVAALISGDNNSPLSMTKEDLHYLLS
jgi:non-specific serine/threonine protein kinase